MAIRELPQLANLWLVTLPRWFAAPVIVGSVLVGAGVSEGIRPLSLTLGLVTVLAVMAWGHAMNTVLDYYWTGLDRDDDPSRRSRPKPYTIGQQALHTAPGPDVIAGAVVWAGVTSGALLLWFSLAPPADSSLVFLLYLAGLAVTFLYSWGKLHWLCELALGLGFATLPGLIGAASTAEPDYLAGSLATLPIFVLFGFAAEVWDQWYDAAANWDKGLRNIGAWLWHSNRCPVMVAVGLLVTLAGVVQYYLRLSGVLTEATYLLSFMLIAVAVGLVSVKPQGQWANHRMILALLGVLCGYCLALGALEVAF